MNILCLYGNEIALELFDWIKEQGNNVILCNYDINHDIELADNIDLTVSYTYPYILKKDIIRALKNNVVNLHNSYLPFNRGSSPNVWSIVEGTPSGVSVHYIDDGVDSGDLISQEIVEFDDDETLESSYFILDKCAKQHFKKVFLNYKDWAGMRKTVVGKGTFHRDSDFKRIKDCFKEWDWNITIKDFKEKISGFEV